MTDEFATLNKLPLPYQMATILRKEIFTGKYLPGDKLPTERELAERCNTSRLTVSKAFVILAQEGWIEMVQGRNNTVLDFRTNVGIEVLPRLFLSCPEAVFSMQLLETMTSHSIWESTQVMLTAAKHATPEDEPMLMAILDLQTADISIAEFYENEFRFYRELIRIGRDLILQMFYTSEAKMAREFIAAGLIREPILPLPRYHEINRGLVKAVCARDIPTIERILEESRKDIHDMLERTMKGINAGELK